MEMMPLNIFQKVMRVWEEAHPYNAAQIMHVAGDPDIDRITAAWNDTLKATGVGMAHVENMRFRYVSVAHQDVEVVSVAPRREGPGIAIPGLTLDSFITREINRPFGAWRTRDNRFAAESVIPFRPFVLRASGTHYVGVTYAHWVADSVGMRMLMREWFCRLYDPARVTGRPLHIPHGGFWHYFGPARGNWNPVEGALATLQAMTQFSQTRRTHESPPPSSGIAIPGLLRDSTGDAPDAQPSHNNQHVEFSVHQLPDGMVNALVEAARRKRAMGVTLNNLCLAALARACDAHGAAPRHSTRDLALGNIVDLRPACSENLDNTFGMFLGFTTLVIPGTHLANADRTLAAVASQNQHHRETRAAHVGMIRMGLGYLQGQYLSAAQLARFYRTFMPFSGGLSNVNMNRSWAAAYHPSPLLDYIRIAPTGPMVPVVIAITTLGNRFTYVLARRASLVDPEHGAGLAQTFLKELQSRAAR